MFGRLTSLLVCAAIGSIGCGCGARPHVPTVTPRSTQVTGVAAGGLAMRIDILIYNPNSYDLIVQSVSAHVTAQGRDLGTVEHAHQVPLPAGQNVPVVVDVTVPWGDLPSLAATAILSAGIPYHVRGRVLVSGVAGFTVEAPFELDGTIPTSMLVSVPSITIPGISLP
jgi:LEA14-like dessication related protein